MTPDLLYRKRLERELEAATWKRGFIAGPHKSQFERTYLENQLLELCKSWESGNLHQWEFQRKSMILHGMLTNLDSQLG